MAPRKKSPPRKATPRTAPRKKNPSRKAKSRTASRKLEAGLVWPGKPSGLEDGLPFPATDLPLLEPYAFYAPPPSAEGSEAAGTGPDPWGRLICGDNIRAMAALLPDLEGRVDLIYMDPPYGTGRPRGTTKGPDGAKPPDPSAGFQDLPASDPKVLSHFYTVLLLARRLLRRTGQIWVHVDHRAGPFARMMMDEIFGDQALRNEIFWHYESGGRARKTYARKADVLLWYTVSGRYTFKPELISKPRNICWKCGSSLEQWNHMKRLLDADGRTYRTIRSAGKIYRYYDDEPVPPSNVWVDIPHIHQKDPQRTGYPAQKPEPLLERILTAHTKPGDLVCDFYGGSGTTPVAAQKLGRRWIACDANPLAVHLSRQRLLALSGDAARPFVMEHLSDQKIPPAGETGRGSGGPERVPVRLKEEKRTCAVRITDEKARGHLDFWAVQWHASADGLFRPQWWSIRSPGKPVADKSPAVSHKAQNVRTVRVLMADQAGTERFVDLKVRR